MALDRVYRTAKATALALAFLSISSSFSQHIQWQYPAPHGENLYSLALIGDETLIAVGSGGMTQTSFNGGLTWTYAKAGRGILRSVSAPDAGHAWVAGDDGVYSSSDLGERWELRLTNGTPFKGVDFANATDGVAWTYDSLFMTTDGGATWDNLAKKPRWGWGWGRIPFYGAGIVDRDTVFRFNGNTAYSYQFQFTTDLGENWANSYGVYDVADQLNGLFVFDTLWVLTGVRGRVAFGNRNMAFHEAGFGNVAAGGITSVLFLDDTLYCFSQSPIDPVMKTGDLGTHWEPVLIQGLHKNHLISNAKANSRGEIFFITQNGAVGVTRDRFQSVELLHGRTQPLPTYDVYIAPSGQGLIVGGDEKEMLITSDAGFSWTRAQRADDFVPMLVRPLGPNLLFGCSHNDRISGTGISSDAGRTWIVTSSLPWDKTLSPVQDTEFQSCDTRSSDIWLSQLNGIVHRSTDGGYTWYSSRVDIWGSDLPDLVGIKISAPRYDTVFVLSSYLVYSSTDQGYTWKAHIVDQEFLGTLTDMHFIDGQRGFVTHLQNQCVYMTTDGAKTWFKMLVFPDGCADRMKIHFLDERTGWIVTNRYVARTTDAGDTWTMSNMGGEYDVTGIWFRNEREGWLVGKPYDPLLDFGIHSMILYTETGGVASITGRPPVPQHSSVHIYPQPLYVGHDCMLLVNCWGGSAAPLPGSIGTAQFEMLNMLGKTVYSAEFGDSDPTRLQASFVVPNIPPGQYFYTLRRGSYLASGKLIVVR